MDTIHRDYEARPNGRRDYRSADDRDYEYERRPRYASGSSASGYGPYGRQAYSPEPWESDRGPWDRSPDETRFGDEEAARRRRYDEASRYREGRPFAEERYRSEAYGDAPARSFEGGTSRYRSERGQRYGSMTRGGSGGEQWSSYGYRPRESYESQRGLYGADVESDPAGASRTRADEGFGRSTGSFAYAPASYSYTEFWLMPGPHAGRGPQGYQRSNENIKEEVCERLQQHGWVDASDIRVQVYDGVVTLEGEVDSRQAKRIADDVAESVSGVRDVRNSLQIRGTRSFGESRLEGSSVKSGTDDKSQKSDKSSTFGTESMSSRSGISTKT